MTDPTDLYSVPLVERLTEKLFDSLTAPLPTFTPRSLAGSVSLPGKVTVVIGIRRAGKTTFLHQLRAERMERGVPRDRLPYVNFEDERLSGIGGEHLHPLLETYYRRYPEFRRQELVSWFLDEIQLVPGWEKFIRRVLDSEKVELFLTGSSAALLSREIATSLRGRAWEVVIHPFSFEEVLRHAGALVPRDPEFLSSPERSALERSFLEYLVSGGFPEVQGFEAGTRRRILSDYVDVAMLRDVVERYGVTNVAALRWMVRHLLGNAAGLFSIDRFFRTLKAQGFSVAKDTVHELLAHLEDCFLVRTVWMEAASERQRMVNPRKAFPVDPGLIEVYDRSGRANIGHALETAVFLELERRGATVTYVKTAEGYEVDFLARYPSGREELLQVCADVGERETLERELRALSVAGGFFTRAKRYLLTLTRDHDIFAVPEGVRVRTAYEWILTTPESQ